MPSKALTICNWVLSTVTEDNLKEFVTIGFFSREKHYVLSCSWPGTRNGLIPKTVKLLCSLTTWIGGFHHPAQSSLETFFIFSNFTLKILDPIPYPTSAIFKFSVRCIFKKSRLWSSSGSTFIWTARMSVPMGLAWNSVESQFSADRASSFP